MDSFEPVDRIELAIVGGGPAGLAATAAARDLGLDTILLDERDPAGRGALVWGIWGTRLAYVRGAEVRSAEAQVIDAGCVILATGSRDRSAIFPGWTLPGVVTVGNAMAADARSVDGRSAGRILLAGSGPNLLGSASRLVERGLSLVAIVEATSTPRLAARDRAWLRRQDVPYLTSSIVVRAVGGDAIDAAIVARVDRDWRVVPDTEVAYDVDRIVLGYGRSASSELTRLAGCRHGYSEDGGYILERDEWLRTSVPGILACGDCAGIGSRRTAVEEGRLAALSAARELGRLGHAEAERRAGPVRQRLARSRRVDSIVARAYATGPGLYEIATHDTMLCRCEGVSVGEVAAALDEGIRDPNVIKISTRAGMGICQARQCGRHLTWLVARHSGLPIGEIEPLTVRPPIKPVPIAALADSAPVEP